MKLRICRLFAIAALVFCCFAGAQALAQNAYITNLDATSVSVIATASNTVTATIPGFSEPIAFGVFIGPRQSSDPVPFNRRINWTYTGVAGGIPNRTTICATFSPGATAAAITRAINACNNGVVFLNAGTYTAASLGGPIQVYKSNVTLRGAGADKTILTGNKIIDLGNGSNVALGTVITSGAAKGSTTFTVASTANLAPGVMTFTQQL